jgi:hypothetical protein
VGVENYVISCDLRISVDQSGEPFAPQDTARRTFNGEVISFEVIARYVEALMVVGHDRGDSSHSTLAVVVRRIHVSAR